MQTASVFNISPCGPLAPALAINTLHIAVALVLGRSGGGLAICYLENQYQSTR